MFINPGAVHPGHGGPRLPGDLARQLVLPLHQLPSEFSILKVGRQVRKLRVLNPPFGPPEGSGCRGVRAPAFQPIAGFHRPFLQCFGQVLLRGASMGTRKQKGGFPGWDQFGLHHLKDLEVS